MDGSIVLGVNEWLGIIGLLIGIFVGGATQIYGLLDNIGKYRRRDFDEWVFFKKHWVDDEYRNSKEFEQDSLIKSVGFLRYFKGKEVDFIIDKNISLNHIKKLNFMFKKEFIILQENKFIIPEKIYVYKYGLKIENILLFIAFITSSLVPIYYAILSNVLMYIFSFSITLVLEFLFLFSSKHIIYYNTIRNELEKGKLNDMISVSCSFGDILNEN